MSDQGTIQFESDSQLALQIRQSHQVVSDQGTIQFESDSQPGTPWYFDTYGCV